MKNVEFDVKEGENCTEAINLHHRQRNSQARGRRHDGAEGVESLPRV